MLNSFFAQMLIALQDRIKAMVPEIREIDQDLSQIDVYEERPPVALPCVLIDFSETTYDQLGSLIEDGTVSIDLRLAFPAYSTSNSLAPLQVRENALKYYELENKLYKALHGWAPDSGICQPLARITAVTEKGREDALRVRRIVFSTMFQDGEASPATTTAHPAIEFDFN